MGRSVGVLVGALAISFAACDGESSGGSTTGGIGGTSAQGSGGGGSGGADSGVGATGTGGSAGGAEGSGSEAGGSSGAGGSAAGTGGSPAGDSAGAESGGSGAGPDTDAGDASQPWDGRCPVGGGPRMVKFADFCIDSTEVTRAQYRAWLDSNPNPGVARQHEFCASNASFEPDSTCLASAVVCQGTQCDNHPMVCVDWCDAHAYCYSVGKRLCGSRQGGGIRGADYRDQAGSEQSQWYTACSVGNARGGADFCNALARSLDTTVAVGSLQQCQTAATGLEGVFDLAGNVWEYVDACHSSDRVRCSARGGSFNSYYASCNTDVLTQTNEPRNHIGFRCCAP
jgi:formylglycine-generating enzyme